MLKRCVFRVCLLGVTVLPAAAGNIDDDLYYTLATRDAGETVSALIYLLDTVDFDALSAVLDAERATLQRRHEVVVTALRDKAAATQKPLLAELEKLAAAGRVTSLRAFWIANVIRVETTKDVIEELAQFPGVDTIYLDYPLALDEPAASYPADPESYRAVEPGIAAVRADDVWLLGIDGTGVLVANMDTGVDGSHPALASRWAGLLPQYQGHPEWAWRDGLSNPPSTFPSDSYGHGTHTMGTVCGLAGSNQIGVAPGAKWIADNSINQGIGQPLMNDIIAGFQWLADPDGNPNTNWDVPAVSSHSWGIATSHSFPPYSNPCDASFWAYIDACEAAGQVVVFSAGNEGPGANTLRRPADRATDAYRNLAVAAVNGNQTGWPIASFSSRGPTYCTPNYPPGNPSIKPDISAPGVNVRSAYPGGGYQYMDGTSMASPHINGVVALIRQACPDLTVTQIKEILYQTAVDLGSAGEDNSYGWGMVDAYEAVLMAQSMCGPHAPHANDGSAATPRNTPVTITLNATDDGLPDPPGAMTYIVVTRPTRGFLRDPQGETIVTVPYTLLNNGNQVVYTPNAYYDGNDAFTFKANDGGVPPEGGDSNVANVALTVGGPTAVYTWNMDTNPGWTTQSQWAWGTPTGGGGEYGCRDPNSGFTGTKVYGYNLNGDYSNNMPEYHLTTTAINCTGLYNTSLRFRRWLGVERSLYDHAYVRISLNGTSWTNVWQNPDSEIADGAWVIHDIDIHNQADNKPTVYLRWTIGTTDSGWRYCGWNIDDVELRSYVPSTVLSGDCNCDGVVNFDDINALVLMLTDFAAWQAQYPGCDWRNGDCNADGLINFDDINRFVLLLS
jgi:bacillopeptidase F